MKRKLIFSVAALPLALCALDLSDKADIRFAETYAFSTNRAALIATLRPTQVPLLRSSFTKFW